MSPYSNNNIIFGCVFNSNKAVTGNGGGVHIESNNSKLYSCTFIDNTAKSNGGAIIWSVLGNMINCSFINSKSQSFNGIYTTKNLNINGGKGIVYLVIEGTLSGISIVVLNNETYYHPPNTNINLTNKNQYKKSLINVLKYNY